MLISGFDRSFFVSLVVASALAGGGCDEPESIEMATAAHGGHSDQFCAPPLDFVAPDQSDAVIDCTEGTDTGYSSGTAFTITVVEADGKPIEVDTANAYWVMKEAAAADGVDLWIVSGFRTQAQQQYLYGCYVNCNCNNCNLAATPGYSNHQSGHALDLNTSSAGVYTWLANNGAAFGFYRTVPSEDWHWEWWSGGPGGGPCGADPECADPNYGGCAGTTVTRCENGRVESGDCGFFGGTCSVDGGTPHCVHLYCTDDEHGDGCLDETQLYNCDYGELDVGDCAAFGLTCSEEGGSGHCVFPQCADDENATTCADDSTLGACTAGIYEEQACTSFLGGHCSTEGGAAHCVNFLCAEDEFAFGCVDDVMYSCTQGVVETGDCSVFGLACSEEGGAAHCVQGECVGQENASLGCTESGELQHCQAGIITETSCGVLGSCNEAGAGSTCISALCDDDLDGSFCQEDLAMNCESGNVTPIDCAATDQACSTSGGTAHCVDAECIDDESSATCIDSFTQRVCEAGLVHEIQCPQGCGDDGCLNVSIDDDAPDAGGGGGVDAGAPGTSASPDAGGGDDVNGDEEASARAAHNGGQGDDLPPSVEGGCAQTGRSTSLAALVVGLVFARRRRRGAYGSPRGR